MQPSELSVVAVISNPVRYQSRYRLYKQFEQHMLESGVHLVTVEAAFQDRPFVITQASNPNDLQVRYFTEVWNKESLQNLGIHHLSRIKPDWKYVATLDADIAFVRKDWHVEILEALRHYSVIQPWSDCYDLGPQLQHIQHHRSFLRQYIHGVPIPAGKYDEFGHPGYAWAWRREALEGTGGFLDIGACGAGDHHMALALIGKGHTSLPLNISDSYRFETMLWQERARDAVKGNVGYIEGAINHFHHGPKARRFYQSRWDILTSENYDPRTDIVRNSYGVIDLAGNKPRLRDKLRAYFRSRDEDSPEI